MLLQGVDFCFLLRKVHWEESEVHWDVKNILLGLETEPFLAPGSHLVTEGVKPGFYYFIAQKSSL